MALHRFRDLDGNLIRFQLPLAGLSSQVFLGTGTLNTRFIGATSALALGTTSIPTGTLRAYPVYVPRTMSFDRIGCDLATSATAGGQIRIGVYASESDTNPKPTRLLHDSGNIATDVAVAYLDTTPSRPVLMPGPAIYWLANITGTAAPGMRSVAQGALLGLLGWPDTGGANQRTILTKTMAFGALPNPFGAISSIGTANPCAIGLRLVT